MNTPEEDERIRIANQMYSEIALIDPIKAVGITRSLLRMTRSITTETGEDRTEQGGFFGGVIKNGVLCIINNHPRGMNCGGVFRFDSRVSPIQEEIDRKVISSIPGYQTVIYHNHPRESRKTLRTLLRRTDAENCIETIKRSLESGVYSPLGITNLDEAINEELSRMISEEDVRNTPGRYNLIISPTLNRLSPSSHLNFYDLVENCLVPIAIIREADIRKEKRKTDKVVSQVYIEKFGSDDLMNLSPEGYRKAFYAMHGLDLDHKFQPPTQPKKTAS